MSSDILDSEEGVIASEAVRREIRRDGVILSCAEGRPSEVAV